MTYHTIAMCIHYTVRNCRPWCLKYPSCKSRGGRPIHPGIKCHEKRDDCPYYQAEEETPK
jgi:hypothetical protein